MAQLESPGVSVTVIDESFYTPAAPGTTPLIIVASAQDKQNGAGTGVAQGTTTANAGKVWLMTSQKDLSDTFGTPRFITDSNNNPVHGSELNEYGLQAAYSYLGVSNRAFIVRADIDLAQLAASAAAPTGEVANGTYWIDTGSTKFGIFQWNSSPVTITGGQTFTNKVPTVITDSAKLLDGGQPRSSVGTVGEYAVVATTSTFRFWYKAPSISAIRPTMWVEIGSPDWVSSWPTVVTEAVDLINVADGSEFNIRVDDVNYLVTIDATALGSTSIVDIVDAINLVAPAGVFAVARGSQFFVYSDFYDISFNDTAIDPGDLVDFEALNIVPNASYTVPALQISKHTQVPNWKLPGVNYHPSGSIWIKTTEYNAGAKWVVKRYNSSTESWATQLAPLYPNGHEALYGLDLAGGGSKLPINTLYIKTNDGENDPVISDFKVYRRSAVGPTTITSDIITDTTFTNGVTYSVSISESLKGQNSLDDEVIVSFVGADPLDLPPGTLTKAQADAEALVTAISEATDLDGNGFFNITAEVTTQNKVKIIHLLGGDFTLVDDSAQRTIATLFVGDTNFFEAPPNIQDDVEDPNHFLASLWKPLSGAVNSATAPTTDPADGTLWYNSINDEIDILVNNGAAWVGYQYDGSSGLADIASPYYNTTDPEGPIVSATEPTKQSDGVTDLADGDIWINPSVAEFYPLIFRWNGQLFKFEQVDQTDNTTENGILFADVRWGVNGGTTSTSTKSTIKELLSSDYVDPDCPDPVLYPTGMMLWNLRRSGSNVKRYVKNYIDTMYGAVNTRQDDESTVGYFPSRWVTASSNYNDGSGRFGRDAQRQVVIESLRSLVNSNQNIRDEESRVFNLIATPGYTELISNMVSLNYDRGLTAFVVGDSPSRLFTSGTVLSDWGSNVKNSVTDDDEGLVTSDEYLAVFYPWGFTSDNLGKNIVVPPSHMMLRTIALSDNVSYPWFAPAGTRRGGITNASAVGYIDYTSGEFQSIALNTGQRDVLQKTCKVNPLTFITGTGLVNYGQLTRARNASSLDRINVARLVVYLRRQLNNLAKPYIFEPNDKITRDEIKQAAESLMLELVGQRAIYDFLVVCDTSNNTPSRIDRNELYLDIAIEPVKAVEFIYIPLRLKNTGEIKGLGGK